MFPMMFLGPYPQVANSHPNTPTTPKNSVDRATTPKSSHKYETPNRRFWGLETNHDSLYNVYLKKITYSSNAGDVSTMTRHSRSRPSDCRSPDLYHGNHYNTGHKQRRSKSVDKSEIQCLQWETRQIRILKAATLDHIIDYILLLTPHQKDQKLASNHHMSPLMEEERNDVSKVMHVLFCAYRLYCQPYELYKKLVSHSTRALPDQFRFVLHYWMTNYPEDFMVTLPPQPQQSIATQTSNSGSGYSSSNSCNNYQISSSSSSCSSITGYTSRSALESSSSLSFEPIVKGKKSSRPVSDQRLVDSLLAVPCLDDTLYRKALMIAKQCKSHPLDSTHYNGDSPNLSTSSRIIESDPKFVAQQLTAIDLENFLSLKAYTLLFGPKQNPKVQNMIKNFNLLSKHVIITILKAQSPEFYATQWISIAHFLRKMKNFNSLKAVIAGLTNESIFRLKNTVWSKLNRTTATNFKNLSIIVDDVDNQTLLRQTQLEIEGTAKSSPEEESFGTIPYLGTFLTDLTYIDTKMSNYLENHKNPSNKLINLEKCSEQFEIVTQIHLLQKNITAALTAYHQTRQLSNPSQLPTTPSVPRISRVFRTWFNDSAVSNMTDNDCYKLSLALEHSPSQKK